MTAMRKTSSKRGALVAIAALVVLLGLAYPAVTFAATGGTSTPPSTINTCTKVNAKTHLYGKTKVSASPVCPAGMYAQTWTQGNEYSWNPTLDGNFPSRPVSLTGNATFPAGSIVTPVSATITTANNVFPCPTPAATASLIVDGGVIASWTLTGDANGALPQNTSSHVLSNPSGLTVTAVCGIGGLEPGSPTVAFNVTFRVTGAPPGVIPYS
jgi:hypothetical protein